MNHPPAESPPIAPPPTAPPRAVARPRSHPRPRRPVSIRESFHVVVECASEAEQQAVYEQLQHAGRRCRLLTM
jgi:hypothetical protein